MSTIAQSKHSEGADLRCRSSTGDDEACPIRQPGPQIGPQSLSFALAAHHQSKHITRTCALDHRARSRTNPSTAHRANLKSP